MKPIVMRIALLVGLILSSASNLSVPALSAPPMPGGAVKAAAAAVPPLVTVPPRRDLPVVRPGIEPARAAGYAIPADHPRPPLGHFKLTAYSGPQLGQARPITATGTSARAGRTIAVDPTVIPLGSRVYIEGIGERIAEDVGGGVRGQHIDLYLSSLPEAREFGVQRRAVTVLVSPARCDS